MMKIVSSLNQAVTHLLTPLLIVSTATVALAEPYSPPPGLGAPSRRESAGTRGCVFGNPPQVISLVPESGVGWTTAAYPTLYWYLPINQAQFVRVTLERPAEAGADAEILYETRFAVTGDAGIMSVQIPETASIPPLEVGDRYRWQVSVFCNADSPDGDLQVDGWIERQSLEADLADRLATADATATISLYASNGYWYDALDHLATLQAANPDDADIQASWAEFLNSVDLGILATRPLATPPSEVTD